MANLKFILDGNGKRIYPITIANGVVYIKSDGTQQKLSDFLDNLNTSLSTTSANAATKVSGATEGNFAGLDKNGNLTDSGSKASDFATAEQGKKADSAVQSVVETASTGTDGTITVDGSEVAVKGLKSAAYTESSAYDAAGAAASVESAVIGKEGDAATAETIHGAKAYADSLAGNYDKSGAASTAEQNAKDYTDTKLGNLAGALIYKGTVSSTSALPTYSTDDDKKNNIGATYAVAEAGTYGGWAMEKGDYLIWNGSSWDGVNGENQVSNDAQELKIGEAVQIATVDGTAISVKQVEDTTKLECEACKDTTEYADVSDLFTAAAA